MIVHIFKNHVHIYSFFFVPENLKPIQWVNTFKSVLWIMGSSPYDVGEETEGLENELCSAHSPNLPLLHLHHSSFSNPSVASPTSQLILQSFQCFTYITAHSLILPLLHLHHRHFTYVTWRAAHALNVNPWPWNWPADKGHRIAWELHFSLLITIPPSNAHLLT